MKVERESLPDNDDEAASGHMEIATLLEQSILLIDQTFNSITYHRRVNILNVLIGNSIKVKEILKERSLDLDDMENPYLFGEQFEEKLIKITSVKQKSKSIFTGLLQRKPTFSSRPNYNQPFLSGLLPGNQQVGSTSGRGRGFFFSGAAAARGKNLQSSVSSTESGNSQSRNILTHTSCNKRFISFKGVPKLSTGGSSPIFFRKLGETYKRPLHFEHSEHSLSVSAYSEIFSPTYFNDPSEKNFSGPGDRTNVKERCNKSCSTRSRSSPQLNICCSQ